MVPLHPYLIPCKSCSLTFIEVCDLGTRCLGCFVQLKSTTGYRLIYILGCLWSTLSSPPMQIWQRESTKGTLNDKCWQRMMTNVPVESGCMDEHHHMTSDVAVLSNKQHTQHMFRSQSFPNLSYSPAQYATNISCFHLFHSNNITGPYISHDATRHLRVIWPDLASWVSVITYY